VRRSRFEEDVPALYLHMSVCRIVYLLLLAKVPDQCTRQMPLQKVTSRLCGFSPNYFGHFLTDATFVATDAVFAVTRPQGQV